MNVVDPSGWLEYFADRPNADFFASAIESISELVKADLTGANLSRAELRQAKLLGPDLSGARLTGADLHDAWYNYATSGQRAGTPLRRTLSPSGRLTIDQPVLRAVAY